jgi:type I restriction enzyme, S subunit
MKLPNDWRYVELRTIAAINRRSLPSSTDNNYKFRYLELSAVDRGRVSLPKEMTAFGDAPSRARRIVQKGDVLMSMVRPNLEGFAHISGEASNIIVSTGFAVITVEKADPSFIYHALFGSKIVGQLNRLLVGSGYPAINSTDVEELVLALPCKLDEQRKIAEILSTWDEALEKVDALIEAKERRKKALMQQLLTGKKRVKGFSKKWIKVSLSDVAENIADQNKGRMGTESLYGVTKAEGVVPMREHVKGESFARCKRVEANWFAYNPMRINIGSIACYRGDSPVMVSGDYVVFRCNEERLLADYLDQLRKTWMWESFVTRGGNGSVRVRIYFADLGEFHFPCPSIPEQRAISEILNDADREIRLLRTERGALDQQKRGLMQWLLTGKVRVKV